MAEKQVFPTRGNLILAKKSLMQAKIGYDLMDRKRNILIREMVILSEKSKELRNVVEETFSKAYMALQKSNIISGLDSQAVWQIPIDNGVRLSYRSVMGVEIPSVSFSHSEEYMQSPPYSTFLSNSLFDSAYVLWNKAKETLAVLAEVENSIYRLALAIKKTQRRANALENILIPRYNAQVKFIASALEEKEREEFSRQKVIKSQTSKHKKVKNPKTE